MIDVNGYEFRTLEQPLYLEDGRQVIEVYQDGVKVYPDRNEANNEPWVVKLAGEATFPFRRNDSEHVMRASFAVAFVSSVKMDLRNVSSSFRFSTGWDFVSGATEDGINLYTLSVPQSAFQGTHSVQGDRDDISGCQRSWHVEACVWFDTDATLGVWSRDGYYTNYATPEAEMMLDAMKGKYLLFPYHGEKTYSYEYYPLTNGSSYSLQNYHIGDSCIGVSDVYRLFSYSHQHDGIQLSLLDIPVRTVGRYNGVDEMTTDGITITTIPYTRLLYSNLDNGEEAPVSARHVSASDLLIP